MGGRKLTCLEVVLRAISVRPWLMGEREEVGMVSSSFMRLKVPEGRDKTCAREHTPEPVVGINRSFWERSVELCCISTSVDITRVASWLWAM